MDDFTDEINNNYDPSSLGNDSSSEETSSTSPVDNIGNQKVPQTPELVPESSAEISSDERYHVPGADKRTVLSGLYRKWFLEYASYVILERAVPHIADGLKPVQRRILHAMYTLDDGRFNKVANVVGNTMQYHPHGDASIADALVQLGQKDLLIDTQGNWGNIITGDRAAASRYIEARLSEFALETVYSPKVTEWTPSYDGRKNEPVTLPVKFPLLLAQGVEGIAVGLSSKILPHNFNEICEAAVSYLKGEEFSLLPDFQTGGLIDVSRYRDGERGGAVKVRAKIEKIDNKTLAITELPFGKTTKTIIASIIAAQEKGKIKIRRVDDNTAANANIVVHLIPGTSSDKTIDALYAFTDCEVSISTMCCVINDNKPHFLSVSDVLRFNVDHTREILLRELQIKLHETREEQFFLSLEKIFIENRIYKDKPLENAPDMDTAVAHIFTRLEPWKDKLYREVTRDDIMRLWEIKMGRILKFNSDKATDRLAALDKNIASLLDDIEHITDFTIKWYEHLKEKYGARFPRNTVVRDFDNIEATKVAEANRKLYFDRERGFAGTAIKDGEFICNCSDIDDIIVFYKDGRYKLMRVQDKFYVDKNVIHLGVFKRNDRRTVYNVVYLNGKGGPYYKKRFQISGLTRDKEYNLTRGLPGSKVLWLSSNPNGEAEVLRITLKPKPRLKILQMDLNFADMEIKGKNALGNLVTKNDIARIALKEKGASTLGGRKVWFDPDVLRLNYEGRGNLLGEFQGNDQVLIVTRDGQFYTTDYSDSNHYEDTILQICKFNSSKVYTAALYDASQKGYPYIKRFRFEQASKPQRFVGDDERSSLILLTDTPYPRLEVVFGGPDEVRGTMEIEAEEFVAVKGYKAKGKRVSNYEIRSITELEPTRQPEPEESAEEQESAPNEIASEETISQVDVRDELTGQQQLFTEDTFIDSENA